MKNNKRKWIISAVIFGIVFIACAVILIMMLRGCEYDFSRYKNTDTSSVAESTAATDSTESSSENKIEVPLPENPIKWAELKKQNNEIYAWIKIPGTKVDYPIVQSLSDDAFYLRRDYLGNPSVSGCIFTQSVNNRFFTDPNTLVYGHYMYDGTFFGSLHNFRDPEFFEKYDTVYVYIQKHILTYKIFAAYEYDSRYIPKAFDFSDKKVFEQYLKDCLNPQSVSRNVRDGVTLNADSRIITLSTCVQNSDSSKRYLVQGVLIKDEATK